MIATPGPDTLGTPSRVRLDRLEALAPHIAASGARFAGLIPETSTPADTLTVHDGLAPWQLERLYMPERVRCSPMTLLRAQELSRRGVVFDRVILATSPVTTSLFGLICLEGGITAWYEVGRWYTPAAESVRRFGSSGDRGRAAYVQGVQGIHDVRAESPRQRQRRRWQAMLADLSWR